VENAIKSKGLKIPVGDVGRVVLDPELAISQAFHATALPTVVVIDGEGVVRAVDAGFVEKVRETYRRKIDDLLAK
jgi:fructose-specific component phosphotransferase system IIB-like protein